MRKLIILSFLFVVQASDLEKFYGTWTQVAFYPISGYVPACIQFSFEKDSRNIDCVCKDGKNATLVEIGLLLKSGDTTLKTAVDSYPAVAVDTPNEVALTVPCVCGEKQHATRIVARSVDENFFIMYEKYKNKKYTKAEPSDAYVFAKKVPKHADLVTTLQSIEDLKSRRGAAMCAKDVNLEE